MTETRLITRILILVFVAVAFSATASARDLRIHVLGLFRPTNLTLKSPFDRALLVRGGGHSVSLEYGQTAELQKAGNRVECITSQRVLSATSFRASSRDGGMTEFLLGLPGRLERRYIGALEVRVEQDKLVAFVTVDLEIAVASAVAAEAEPGVPLEALKAQAVVARSYYSATQRRHRGFDFCDTTHCQFLREPPATGAPARLAAESTRGLVLRYQGSVLPALFSASCGGRTRSLREVGLRSEGYPYFPVDCPACLRESRRWERQLKAAGAVRLLEGVVCERLRLEIGRKLGWSAFPSNNFSTRIDDGTLTLEGRGAGHGVGLCQSGAKAMARAGSTFGEILSRYYMNAILGSEDE